MELVRTVARSDGDAARERLVAAIAAVAAGDRRAFHELYQRSSAKLYGVCCRILGEGQDAEDALQEAYANVWRRADRFDASRASPITWLAAIARNAAIDRLRARGSRSAAPIEEAFDIADAAPLADTLMEQASDARRLHGCLGELGGGEAALIRTAFLEGASYPELAARAGEPLGTIKSRIRRALIKLRECLCR
ncbi:sigma-70 family RNA polymerase sigma factor [Sphingomonas sp. MAH-20]|uniref:Sigma-70 family RNA polymerase sigma factor n=1 Tax=Sphingomonas horti TaxID=2682842 RepID=A0A6I4J8L5_9SPHN|nr:MULTISPECIES: sigma-70 family RNA polymerase sigma factor [Sphingomonas]MBA2919119.1 sigma-70 family RNA polymerase sigma factor [Sphingomonas sp. CGMCC 1.13658]MVO79151.1 sigma-70 family RNA polymerase sigma factor [Sphingomonas horti]